MTSDLQRKVLPMFYLLRSDRTLQWIDYALSQWVSAVQNNDVKLDRLDWQEADPTIDRDDILSLGLRHGTACNLGLLIPGHLVNTVDKPRKLAALHRSNPLPREALLENARLMEQVVPGWTASLKQDMAELGDITDRQIMLAQVEAESLLNDTPTKPELLHHWESLGGFEQRIRFSAN
jgi:hypothetical protein